MPVEVYRSDKKKENPLDKIAQLTSIGVGAATIGSKLGGDAKPAVAPDDLELGEAVDDSALKPKPETAIARRFSTLKQYYG